MHRRSPRLAGVAVVALLVLAVAACAGSDNSDGGAAGARSADKPSTTVASGTTRGASGGTKTTIDATTVDSITGGPIGAKGSGTATPADGKASPEKTITYQDDGSLDKTDLTVAVGEKFTFAGSDNTPHSICVADAACLTVVGGLVETFTIDEPGTYRAVDDFDNSVGATIVVT